jgi:uncharacterized protein (DUF885 family)
MATRFEAISPDSLSPNNQIDRKLAIQFFKYLALYIGDFDLYAKKPLEPLGKYGDTLFLMLMREYSPIDSRLKMMGARIEKTAQFFTDTKDIIGDSPDKLWTQLAIKNAAELPSFLDVIDKVSNEEKDRSDKDKKRLSAAIDKAKPIISSYQKWLEDEILPKAKENQWRVGKDLFERILKIRELGFNADEIKTLGKQLLDAGKLQIQKVAKDIDSKKSPKEVIADVKSVHPTNFEDTIKLYRDAIQEAREYMIAKDVLTLPANEIVECIATPGFLRDVTPSAAIFTPAVFDEPRKSVYMVTPPPPEHPEYFKAHASIGIPNTCVHESYPGHHVQLAWWSLNRRPIRILLSAILTIGVELIEGWAHYCEQYMINEGFHDTPEALLLQLSGDVWRCARMIIDCNIQTGVWSFEEAVEFLSKEADMPKATAQRELNWYTQRPSYPLSYRLGKHLLFQLRDTTKAKYPKKYTDKWFHDTLLKCGKITYSVAQKIIDIADPPT